MKMTAFRAVCPVEIGDEIFIIEDKAYYLVPGVKVTPKIHFCNSRTDETLKILQP